LAVFLAAFRRGRAGLAMGSRNGLGVGAAGRAGIAKAGDGVGGGSGSPDIGVSSIHPPLVQPVSISSSPDIGAPLARGAAWPAAGQGAEAPM
jgi:hypothetical protein